MYFYTYIFLYRYVIYIYLYYTSSCIYVPILHIIIYVCKHACIIYIRRSIFCATGAWGCCQRTPATCSVRPLILAKVYIIYSCTHICTHTHIYIYTYIHTYIYIYVHIYVYMYVYLYIHVCKYV
jgi:hypothetical protein